MAACLDATTRRRTATLRQHHRASASEQRRRTFPHARLLRAPRQRATLKTGAVDTQLTRESERRTKLSEHSGTFYDLDRRNLNSKDTCSSQWYSQYCFTVASILPRNEERGPLVGVRYCEVDRFERKSRLVADFGEFRLYLALGLDFEVCVGSVYTLR